ncbi:MAG: HAMP domain-containing histidine kinase [Clostridiales Family XIII bacterium]|nr:HAMP domain-containing histidine kinase [Clostridiales Family XIII bacterium]
MADTGQYEAVSGLISDITHSLRMPLAVVIGYAELLQKGRPRDGDAQTDEYIAKILEHARFMNERLSNLVSVARLDFDEGSIVRIPVDVVALIRNVAKDMDSVVKSKGSRIRIESDCESIIATIDAFQFLKVLYNLTDNALKHTKRASDIRITVSCSEGRMLIVFRDEGMGLPKEEMERIFESGYQGSNSGGGSGYGLHHARMVAEAHGGEIFAKGAPGKGLGIYIRIPIGGNADSASAGEGL